MTVGDAQHLGTVGVVTPGLTPQVGQLQRRHQQFDRPCPLLLLTHDAFDLAQNAQAQRQPGVDAGGLLFDHAGAQHQLVRHDLGVGRGFFEGRQEVARQAHVRISAKSVWPEVNRANGAKARAQVRAKSPAAASTPSRR
ncbi:hypothetical protein D3C71_1806980 [compost metagenome]